MSTSVGIGADEEQLIARTRELLRSVEIPICPKYLLQLNVELREPNIDLVPVAEIVAHDVGLTARVLKIANSALFGSRVEIDSIPQALTRLGIRNFRNAVMAGALRQSLGNMAAMYERFWSHSEMVAMIAQKLAIKLCPTIVESAYLGGLFHDCGIPLMLKRFPTYPEHMNLALSPRPEAVAAEEAAFATQHAAAGALLTRNWNLPQIVTLAVRHHHGAAPELGLRDDVCMLIGMVQVAERVEISLNHEGTPLFGHDELELEAQTLEALQIDSDTLHETTDELIEAITA